MFEINRKHQVDEDCLSQQSLDSQAPQASSCTSSNVSPSVDYHSAFDLNLVHKGVLKRYQLGEVLGEGAFSVVYEAKDNKTGDLVAVKVIDKQTLTAKQYANVKNEISVMKKASGHSNILKLLNHVDTSRYCYLILEHCDGGEIFKKIIHYTYLSEKLSRHVFVQVLSAVDYLHNTAHVVHRDIKPENLIVTSIPYHARSKEEFENSKRISDDETKLDEGKFVPGVGGGTIGTIKLADFGLAKHLRSEVYDNLKTPCGTAGYTAPEVISCTGNKSNMLRPYSRLFQNKVSRKNHYSKAVDIWSLGCFLYTMLCGFPPFYDDDQDVLTDKILKGEYNFLKPWWDEIGADVQDLIIRMLDVNPDTRITIDKIWTHKWVKEQSGTPLSASPDNSPEENYFSMPAVQKDDRSDNLEIQSVEHIEFSSDLIVPMSKSSSTSPLHSPRAKAIKVAFNNRAMATSKVSSLANLSGNSLPADSLDSDSSSDEATLPQSTHSPSYSHGDILKVSFKNILKIKESYVTEEEESSSEDIVPGLESGYLKTRRFQTYSGLDDSDDEIYEKDRAGLVERSSSIISGMTADFKFTLTMNDSNLLTRRKSLKTGGSATKLVASGH